MSRQHNEMTAAERKERPLYRGVLKYFPDALMDVARLSKIGSDQHSPGQPMRWAKEKSTDHGDCILRHLLDAGTVDTDGVRHSAKVAWRALALLQIEIEEERKAEGARQIERQAEDSLLASMAAMGSPSPLPDGLRCVLCGATEAQHKDVRGLVRGHQVRMSGMPQDGTWHPFTLDLAAHVFMQEYGACVRCGLSQRDAIGTATVKGKECVRVNTDHIESMDIGRCSAEHKILSDCHHSDAEHRLAEFRRCYIAWVRRSDNMTTADGLRDLIRVLSITVGIPDETGVSPQADGDNR